MLHLPLQAAEDALAVLQEFRASGYRSPVLALERLQQADAPGARASLEHRWRFDAALSRLALAIGAPELADTAVRRLQTMAESEACAPCSAVLVVRREQQAESSDPESLRRSLAELSTLPDPTDPPLRFEWLTARARAHALLGQDDAAIADLLTAADVAEAGGLSSDLVLALDALGRANATRRDLKRALEFSARGIALAREMGFQYGLVRLLFNRSYQLAQLKENPERRSALLEVVQLSKSTRGLENFNRDALINLAALSNDLQEYHQAAGFALEAEKLVDRKSDPNGEAFALVNRGVAWVHLGRTEEGLALVQQAIVIAEKTASSGGDKRELADLIEQQVRALEAAGRSQPALAALHRWVRLNTELTNSQREQAIAMLQESVAAQQRLREIERLRLENDRSEAELELRRWRERAWAAAALAVALLAFLIWRRLTRSRRVNRRLRKDVARLSDESHRDALTGVGNRRFGEERLQHLDADNSARPEAERARVALLLLDADHFKRVNDTHGHAAGDAVLIELSRRMRAVLRDGDAVVRWGGEEFLLILPRADEQGLGVLTRRLLAAIGSQPFALPQGQQQPVRVSAGGLIWTAGSGVAWSTLLALADAALYRAKTDGRNRAVLAFGATSVSGDEADHLDALIVQGRLRLDTVAGVPVQ